MSLSSGELLIGIQVGHWFFAGQIWLGLRLFRFGLRLRPPVTRRPFLTARVGDLGRPGILISHLPIQVAAHGALIHPEIVGDLLLGLADTSK